MHSPVPFLSTVLCLAVTVNTTFSWHLSRPSSRSCPTARFAQAEGTSNTGSTSLNPLISLIKPSKTVEIFSLVKDMEAEGIKVTSLCVGEPDFLPSPVVLKAIMQAVQDGATRYTAVTGTLALRQAIAHDLQRRKGVTYNPKTEIVVANGAKQCVYQGILATAGVGDKVLIPAPYWTSYPEMVLLTGAEPVIVETKAETGFLMTGDELREALTQHPEIKLIIICNPSNPTGGVYHEEQLLELVNVLNDFPAVKVLADEIYERLVYEGDCPSVAAQPGMFERTLTVNGFSKSYAMTGMRLGYLAAPEPIARAVTTIQSQLTSCAGSISQAAGVAALTHVTDEELENNVQIMKEKRDYVLQELSTMPHVKLQKPPEGAFYVLPDVSAYGDDTVLCLDLLREKQLALVPGEGFGAPGTVRLSYATSMGELVEAMNKLRSFLEDRKVVG
jgi:bifunctional aspartate aminotransferase and glutamate/aspartate-prephenate aminotransferase